MEIEGKISVACQTDPNLIDKLIDNYVRKQLDDIDLYQEYVRSAQCAQFWPLDKNPIRSLVPSMVKVDLPEQHLKNESLMFDLVRAITSNSKLVNLLAKYIHHIVPNVIISKRIDLIPLITCTIRVCHDAKEQERLISLLFNLIKRPNEEQRRMILSGIIVVLQVSPHQNSSLLLPNLWDHVSDKFPERRILLAESCASLAHYVRPALRTNLILSILIQLLKDKNPAVRSAASKSFSCLLTLIMDRNDEVFDACLSATEDIIHDVLQQTPVNFCEHRYELEQMRFCALETIYPLLCMWSVKLNRFRQELAEFYLSKAHKYFNQLLNQSSDEPSSPRYQLSKGSEKAEVSKVAAVAAMAKRRSVFFESRNKHNSNSIDVVASNLASDISSSVFSNRRKSAHVTVGSNSAHSQQTNSAMITAQKAVGAYLKMINYLVPYVFSDSVHSCAWLSKSQFHLPSPRSSLQPERSTTNQDSSRTLDSSNPDLPKADQLDAASRSECSGVNDENNNTSSPQSRVLNQDLDGNNPGECPSFVQLFERQIKYENCLLDPTLIIDESAIVAFHDQLEQEHMLVSLDWILKCFLPKFLSVISYISHRKFYSTIIGGSNDLIIQEFLHTTITSTRNLCLLFGRHLTRNKIRNLIKDFMGNNGGAMSLLTVYLASLTSFEPVEQQEFEEIVSGVSQILSTGGLTRNDIEILGISLKIMATSNEHIQSPSTRQKFLTYILDALVTFSIKAINTSSQQTQTREFILIIFRHILTCLIDESVRPTDWAQILVTKFLPLLISLANDSTDVYVCTYARLMCAQLVETFDNYLHLPELTRQNAETMLPALDSLKNLTNQIKASNLKRQIECLTLEIREKFFESSVPE